MSISTENVPGYAKWPTVGLGVGAAVALGTHGLNQIERATALPDDLPRTPPPSALRYGGKAAAMSSILIFDVLAATQMPLPEDRNAAGAIGAGVGALMAGGTAASAAWLFADKDSALSVSRQVGKAGFKGTGYGLIGGAIAGAVFAGRGQGS